MDSDSNDFVTGFNLALTRDGQGQATSNLPMAGFRHTGVGDGIALTDYISVKQVQQNSLKFAVAGGTADALSATLSPPPTLVDGMQILVRAIAANATTNPTLTLNGGSALLITKFGGSALAAGDIVGALHELELRYNLAHTRWELLNPAPGSAAGVALLASANTFTADQTIQSTDAGAGAAPNLILDRFSASPAASDVLAYLQFLGRSSTAVARIYAGLQAAILDPTNASEDARLDLRTIVAGAVAARLSIGQGIWTPNATGGDKGADSVNASALYIGGVKPVLTVKQQIILNTATYTPSTGMLFARVRAQAPGGGSGATSNTSSVQAACSGGGGGGEFGEGIFSAATIGVSQSVTIGAQGAAGAASGGDGGTGGTTSFGALLTCIGGSGGTGAAATGSPSAKNAGGAGGTGGTGGNYHAPGEAGGPGWGRSSSNSDWNSNPGAGGRSVLGAGAQPDVALTSTGAVNSVAGPAYGSGAAGNAIGTSASAKAGALGGAGIVIIDEYCSQ